MIIYVAQVIYKWFQVFLLSLISIFNVASYVETNLSYTNIINEITNSFSILSNPIS